MRVFAASPLSSAPTKPPCYASNRCLSSLFADGGGTAGREPGRIGGKGKKGGRGNR